MSAPNSYTQIKVAIDDVTAMYSTVSAQHMQDTIMMDHMRSFLVTKTTNNNNIGGVTNVTTWTSGSTATTSTTGIASGSSWYSTNKKSQYYQRDDEDTDNPYGVGGRYVHCDDKGRLRLRAGDKIVLPDGCEINVDLSGNYTINDKDAKVVYRANRSRDFNRYINASDLLEEFLLYLKAMGAKRKDIAKVDLGTFITWLIIAAAEADQMEKPQDEVLALEHHVKQSKLTPQCKCCKRFIPKRNAEAGIFFCNGAEMDRYRERIAA